MRRLLSGAAGVLLVVTPPMMVYGMTVPVPQYRTGTFADVDGASSSSSVAYLPRLSVLVQDSLDMGFVPARLISIGPSSAWTTRFGR
jgi:hypothetical protein